MKHNYNHEMIALRRYYISMLPDKITALETAWRDYLKVSNPEKLRVLFRQAHNLYGSAGTYGYKEISALAKKLDKMLRAQNSIDAETKARITAIVAQLKSTCDKLCH